MPLTIDRPTLRALRDERAWTQEQLAAVADLSLRTVQRIEASGQPSQESLQAIAAALFILPAVLAQPVMLEVAVVAGQEELVSAQLLSDEGRQNEVLLPNELRILLESRVTDAGEIFVEVELFEPGADGAYELVAEPAVLTADGRTAGIEFAASSGRRYALSITPRL